MEGLGISERIDESQYTRWHLVLSEGPGGEGAYYVFNNRADAEHAFARARRDRHYRSRELTTQFIPPTYTSCGLAVLTLGEVWNRIRCDLDGLICDQCYRDRRRLYRVVTPLVDMLVAHFTHYEANLIASSVWNFFKHAALAPDEPGVYSFSTPLVTNGLHVNAIYVGQSRISIKRRLEEHAQSFADVLIGPPPSVAPLQSEMIKDRRYLGIWSDVYMGKTWHQSLTSEEYALIRRYSRELWYGSPRSSSTARSRTAKRLEQFVTKHGAAFESRILQLFPDIYIDELRSNAQYLGRDPAQTVEHPDVTRILDAEALWQRRLTGTHTIPALDTRYIRRALQSLTWRL